MGKAPYTKPAKAAADLVLQLTERGMRIDDPARAERYLNFIGIEQVRSGERDPLSLCNSTLDVLNLRDGREPRQAS